MQGKDIEVLERKHKKYDVTAAHRDRTKPHGISGMTRLKNDKEYVEESIVSHLPWLDEAVIVLQPSDDGTEEVAYDIASRYDKIRVALYPFDVAWSKTPEWYDTPGNSVYSNVHLTNWGLSQCEYSWIASIEGDCPALPSFAHIRDLVDLEPEAERYYGRTCLNLAGENEDQFSYTAPHNAGWDVPVMNNSSMWYSEHWLHWASYNMHEHTDKMRPMGWQFIHTKRCKSEHWGGFSGEVWMPFNKENLDAACAEYKVPFMGERNDELLYEWFSKRHAK